MMSPCLSRCSRGRGLDLAHDPSPLCLYPGPGPVLVPGRDLDPDPFDLTGVYVVSREGRGRRFRRPYLWRTA